VADTRKSKTRSSAAPKRRRPTASTSAKTKAAGQSEGSRSRRAQGGATDGRSSASEGAQPSRTRSSSRNGLSALEAAEQAREHLAALLGRPVEAVSGVDRDHGNWIITAQVVELARIPNTTDVLGDYEAVLDKKGEILRYRRTRRYHRGQTDGGQ
jgi:hypothetical protein